MTGRSHPDSAHLFFSIPKLVSFKKLNRAEKEMGKFPNSPRYFCFYFFILIFLYLIFYFYYIKINIFH